MDKKLANAPSCKAYLAAYTASMQPPKVVDRKDALATGAIVASTAITGSMFEPIMAYAGAAYLIYKWVPWAFSKGSDLSKGSDRKGALKRLAKQCQEDYVAR